MSHFLDIQSLELMYFCVPDSCFVTAKSCTSSETPLPHLQTLRFIGHWLNSIAVQGPDAPVILVGTHKDMLKKWPNTKAYRQEKLDETQTVLTDFLNKLPVAKTTHIIENIKRPSGDSGKWFFAVDNKSRKRQLGGELRCKDPSIDEVRQALEQVVLNDQRKVRGWWSAVVSQRPSVRSCSAFFLDFVDTFSCLLQVWMAS